MLFRRGNYRLNCLKGAPPPEVAASVEHAVTAVKKHAKPSVKTRDFFIFVISLVTKDIFILPKSKIFMTFNPLLPSLYNPLPKYVKQKTKLFFAEDPQVLKNPLEKHGNFIDLSSTPQYLQGHRR